MTPRSDGIFLRRDEVVESRTLIRKYDGTIESLTEGIEFGWLDDWPDSHGVYFKLNNVRHIYLPHSTPFKELCSFAHEYHHARFMPDLLLYERSEIEVARWEGKASAFASIVTMPLIEQRDVADIYRTFGKEFEHCAHYRIKHFEKYGW